MEPILYWEANRFSVSQEIPRILRNQKILLLYLKAPATRPNSETDQPRPCLLYPSVWRYILLLSTLLRLDLPKFSSLHQNSISTSPLRHMGYMPRPSHSSRFCHSNNIRWAVQITRLLHSPVTPSLLGPNMLLNTLFSNTLSLRSSLSVRDQVSYPYKLIR